MIDFERRRVRSRIEAALLAAGDRDDSEIGRFKASAIGRLDGTVLEIGPGTGVNLHHYAAGVHVIAAEPNPVMRERLAATADGFDVDLEVRDERAESVDLPDGSVDGVVATLVLCGVDDPERALDEVFRVLRPGGRFVFVEHVAAADGSTTATAQRVLRRPHEWMFNGCRVDQDTGALLRSVAWTDLTVEPVDLGWRAGHVRDHIVGVATR